jgi:PhnB protein
VNRIPLPGDKVMSIALAFGDSVVHVGSEFPDMGIVSPLAIGGTATVLQLNTDDADGLWNRALSTGAETRHELADAFRGERHGQLTDPFGQRWNVAQRLRDSPTTRSSPQPPRPSAAAETTPRSRSSSAVSVRSSTADGSRQ